MSDSLLGQADLGAADLPDWRLIGTALRTRFRTGNFANGLRLLNAIGEAAEEANHHPDLDLRYPHLDITLSSHDAGGVTDRDVALARRISAMAVEQGVKAAPADVEVVE
jgi:4a-hydroxytetrahydrobiopterin dehydratase